MLQTVYPNASDEFNRVKLTHGIKDNPNRDRTNGSLIQFPSLGLHTRFIAIQGPDQPYYINQFWQIVYEYNCDVIVMLASFNVVSEVVSIYRY